MGHAISAIVGKDPGSLEGNDTRGLRLVSLPQGFCLVPVTAELVDAWAGSEPAELDDGHRPGLDCTVVREVAHHVFGRARFAVVETDYFGGSGDQAAVVYENGSVIMEPEVAEVGPINRALRLIGVHAGRAHDEFDALGLAQFRGWDQ